MRVMLVLFALVAAMAVFAVGQNASAAVWVDPAPVVYAPTVVRTVQPTMVYTYPTRVVTYPTTTVVPTVVVPQPGVIRTHVGPFGRVRTTYWGW